jgi:acetyltransferase-like isoleucine patch superfamily enzyme
MTAPWGRSSSSRSATASETTSVGDHVIIGPNVFFVSDPHPACPRYTECVLGPTIGRYTRIGGSVVVNPGVTIGENCLIGSGAVVTRDIPPNTVAAGSPARERLRIEQLKCFKGLYPRAYAWDPPELFDPALFPPNGE